MKAFYHDCKIPPNLREGLFEALVPRMMITMAQFLIVYDWRQLNAAPDRSYSVCGAPVLSHCPRNLRPLTGNRGIVDHNMGTNSKAGKKRDDMMGCDVHP